MFGFTDEIIKIYSYIVIHRFQPSGIIFNFVIHKATLIKHKQMKYVGE